MFNDGGEQMNVYRLTRSTLVSPAQQRCGHMLLAPGTTMTAEEVGGLSCVCFVVKVEPTLKQQYLRRPVIIRLRTLYSGK